jgi:hypothetical protein
MIEDATDLFLSLEQMDREDPSIRYRGIVDSLPRMLARGFTIEQIEASYEITILPQDRPQIAAAAE